MQIYTRTVTLDTLFVTVDGLSAENLYTVSVTAANEVHTSQAGTVQATTANALLLVVDTANLGVNGRAYDGTTDTNVSQVRLIAATGYTIPDAELANMVVSAVVAFADKNVGENKKVAITNLGALSSAIAAKYKLVSQALDNIATTAAITPIQLGFSGAIAANDKDYDGTTSVTLTDSSTLTGVLPGDDVRYSVSGVFADASVGDDKEIVLTWTYAGADAGNYKMPAEQTVTASIRKINMTGTVTIQLVTDSKLTANISINGQNGNSGLHYQWLVDGLAISNADADSYVMSEDDLNKTVTLRVTADWSDDSLISNGISASTLAPAAPVPVVSGITQTGMTVSWNDVSARGGTIQGYKLVVRSSGFEIFSFDVLPTSPLSVVLTGLTAGTSYELVLTGDNELYTSAYSVARVTTLEIKTQEDYSADSATMTPTIEFETQEDYTPYLDRTLRQQLSDMDPEALEALLEELEEKYISKMEAEQPDMLWQLDANTDTGAAVARDAFADGVDVKNVNLELYTIAENAEHFSDEMPAISTLLETLLRDDSSSRCVQIIDVYYSLNGKRIDPEQESTVRFRLRGYMNCTLLVYLYDRVTGLWISVTVTTDADGYCELKLSRMTLILIAEAE